MQSGARVSAPNPPGEVGRARGAADSYCAALLRAPSIDVVESVEVSREAALTGWQDAVDAA